MYAIYAMFCFVFSVRIYTCINKILFKPSLICLNAEFISVISASRELFVR